MKNKKWYGVLVFCLICSFIVSYLGMMSVTAEDEAVYLSDLLLAQPERMTEYLGWGIIVDGNGEFIPGLNMNGNGNYIKLKGKYYGKGIGVHSAEEGDSYLKIDLKGLNYEYFTAIVGMSDEEFGQDLERNKAGFVVMVDDTEVKSTDILAYDSDAVEISVSIKGAETLTLALNPGDTRYSDLANWANAKLSNDPAVDTKSSDSPMTDDMIFLSDYLKNDLSKILEYTGYDPDYEPDIDESPYPGFDETYNGEQFNMYGGILYSKGIGMHSNSDLDTETVLEIDIKDSGFTEFSAIIGMYNSDEPQDVERNVANFIVRVDGKKVYSSEEKYFDTKPEKISVNITGASTLTLEIDPNVTPYADNAIWACALLTKGTGEAAPSPEPSQDVPASETPTLETPAQTSSPTASPSASAFSTVNSASAKASAPTQNASEEGGSSILWIVIIAVVVLAAGAAIAVVTVLKKRKNNN